MNDPYFNEPGYERSRGTPEGDQKSREYNEMTVLRSLEVPWNSPDCQRFATNFLNVASVSLQSVLSSA